MRPRLEQGGLVDQQAPNKAYDTVKFVEEHYEELRQWYIDIMEHLRTPTSSGGGEGVKWITKDIDLYYVDMIMSNDFLTNSLGYSSVEEAIKLVPFRSSIAFNGKHYEGDASALSTVPIQNNNIKPVYMGTNSDGKHIFRYAIENNSGYVYGDEFTFYIKKAVKGGYENPTGYMSTSFTNNYYYMSYTYEVSYSSSYYNPLTLTYISSISNEDGNNPLYTFTEKYIDDSEAE